MESNNQELSQVMENIFLSQRDTDVTFIIHEKEIQAHKLIVTARSPVLKAMIEGPMAPADQRHEISDPEISYEDFLNFIKFLYTDECDIEQSNFKVLLHLANFYDVPLLHEKCADDILLILDNNDNIFEYAEMALQFAPTSTLLLRKCFEMVDAHCDKLNLFYCAGDGSAIWISPELVLEYVKYLKNISTITEDEIFKKVFEWASNYCIQQDQEATPENVQTIMAPFMPHFEPEKLSPATLATIIKEYKLIPVEQLLDYLSNHIMKKFDAGRNSLSLGEFQNEKSDNAVHVNVRNLQRYFYFPPRSMFDSINDERQPNGGRDGGAN